MRLVSLVWIFGYREKVCGFQFGVMMLEGQATWAWVQSFMGLGFRVWGVCVHDKRDLGVREARGRSN